MYKERKDDSAVVDRAPCPTGSNGFEKREESSLGSVSISVAPEIPTITSADAFKASGYARPSQWIAEQAAQLGFPDALAREWCSFHFWGSAAVILSPFLDESAPTKLFWVDIVAEKACDWDVSPDSDFFFKICGGRWLIFSRVDDLLCLLDLESGATADLSPKASLIHPPILINEDTTIVCTTASSCMDFVIWKVEWGRAVKVFEDVSTEFLYEVMRDESGLLHIDSVGESTVIPFATILSNPSLIA